jgi:hypothetical protein
MEKQIREVQQYFKDKILAKDFEIKKIGTYSLEIIIDNQYLFTIWIGNLLLIPEGVKLFTERYNFMDVPFTDEESKKLSKLIHKILIKRKRK